MKFLRSTLLILTLLAGLSCKFKEDTIIPFAEPEKISEIQQAFLLATGGKDFNASSMSYYQVKGDSEHFYLKLRYDTKKISSQDLEVAEEELSSARKHLFGLFRRIFFRLGGEHDVELPPITFELPEFDYDKDIIVDVNVSRIHLEFLNDKDANSFRFVEELDVMIPNRTTKVDELVLGYDKKQNKCDFKCMEFDIYKTSLVELVDGKKDLTINTSLKINKIPKGLELKFKGYVELFVKLKLPF